MPASLPDKIGKFTVVRLLGAGAMGRVYLAKDPDIGRKVAIKVLAGANDQEAIDRFRVEAQAVGKLIHTNIVMLLEFGVQNESPFLVMEYLRGADLSSWAVATRPLEQRLHVLLGLCQGLRYAHSKQVLHRDIKPANVHVLPNGESKLMDFGIAKLAGTAMTATGMLIGTPEFLAPELLSNQPASKASDNYAAALVSYWLLTGKHPFRADSVGSCLARVMAGKITPLQQLRPDLPLSLCGLIMSYLQPVAENRPRSIDPLIERLQQPYPVSAGTIPVNLQTGAMNTQEASQATTAMNIPAVGSKWRIPGFSLLAISAAVTAAWYFSNHLPDPFLGNHPISQITPEGEEFGNPEASENILESSPEKPDGDQPREVEKPTAGAMDSAIPTPGQTRKPIQSPIKHVEDEHSDAGGAKQVATDAKPEAKLEKQGSDTQPAKPETVTNKGRHKAAPAPAHNVAQVAVAPDQKNDFHAGTIPDQPPIGQPTPIGTADSITPGGIRPQPTPQTSPVLTTLAPHRVHRNQVVRLIITGENLADTQVVRLLSGNRPARGFEVLHITPLDEHRLQILLHVGASTRLGRYSLTTSNPNQPTSNALSIQVTL